MARFEIAERKFMKVAGEMIFAAMLINASHAKGGKDDDAEDAGLDEVSRSAIDD